MNVRILMACNVYSLPDCKSVLYHPDVEVRPVPPGRGHRQPAPVRAGKDRGVRGGGPDVPYDHGGRVYRGEQTEDHAPA